MSPIQQIEQLPWRHPVRVLYRASQGAEEMWAYQEARVYRRLMWKKYAKQFPKRRSPEAYQHAVWSVRLTCMIEIVKEHLLSDLFHPDSVRQEIQDLAKTHAELPKLQPYPLP